MAANNGIAYEIIAKVSPAVKAINKLAGAYDKLSDSASKAREVVGEAIPATTNPQIRQTGKSVKQAGDHAKAASGKFGMLLASIKRVAFYRAIRTALKEVTQAFREGTNNLYYYSQALNNIDAAHAQSTMDGFATTALYVKNSLGAALMPVLQSLLPIVNAIADAFVWAANAVNQFFHALKGEAVFTKAKRYAVDYAEALDGASGAAKELKKQVFGFDELNIFNSPNSGGGGGSPGLDYSQMFEEAEIDGIFKRIRDRINENLGADFPARFKINFTEFFTDWKGLNKEKIGKKILTGFYGLMGGLVGFKIAGPMGMIVGSLLGVTLGTYFSTLDFNGDGRLTSDEVASALKDVAGTLTGAAIGWAIGGSGGALIGATVGTGLTALIKALVPKEGFNLEAGTFSEQLRTVAAAITGGIVGWAVGGAGGALLGLTAGTALSTLITNFFPEAGTTLTDAAYLALLVGAIKGITNPKSLSLVPGGMETALALTAATAVALNIVSLAHAPGFKTTESKIGAAIAEALNLLMGASAGGALLGFALGGPGGALIGITLAAGINMLINKIDWNLTPQSKRELDYMNQAVDLNAMANYLGSPSSSKTPVKQSILKAEGRAEGGYVPTGTYFYAGEAGPELIGTVGSKTNVTNQDQFTAGMWDVMDATNTVILQAAQMLAQTFQNKEFKSVVSIGDRDIVSAYDRGKTLAGSALVE